MIEVPVKGSNIVALTDSQAYCLYVEHVSVTISNFRYVSPPGMSIDHRQKERSVATVSIHGCLQTSSRCAYLP